MKAYVAPKGPWDANTWTWIRQIEVGVGTVRSVLPPLLSGGVLGHEFFRRAGSQPPAHPCRLLPSRSALPGKLAAAGTAKPISILIIQKGYAKYCSHIVYENTQDIYYISGGRTGSLIASAGCKL